MEGVITPTLALHLPNISVSSFATYVVLKFTWAKRQYIGFKKVSLICDPQNTPKCVSDRGSAVLPQTPLGELTTLPKNSQLGSVGDLLEFPMPFSDCLYYVFFQSHSPLSVEVVE